MAGAPKWGCGADAYIRGGCSDARNATTTALLKRSDGPDSLSHNAKPAINHQSMAVQIRGTIRAQPGYSVGDFLWLDQTLQRIVGGELFRDFWVPLRKSFQHGRLDDRRADRVHANAGLGVLDRGGAGKSGHSVFAGHVAGHVLLGQ